MILHDFKTIVSQIYSQESNSAEKFRRLLAFMLWQIWKRTIKKPLTLSLFNGFRFRAYPDCHSSSSIIYFRIPEFHEITFLRKLLHKGIVIDIGANVGLFTLLLADKIKKGILFEPNPIATKRALENLLLNKLDFEVQNIALSDKKGEIFLENRGGVNTANMTLVDSSKTSYPVIPVPCTTFDEFIKSKKEFNKIDLIKIDVEGHENKVLKGMSWTLINIKPKIVMFEYLQRTNFTETKTIFNEARYSIYELGGNQELRLISSLPEPLQNLFALPNDIK